jgi:hypothetical protein
MRAFWRRVSRPAPSPPVPVVHVGFTKAASTYLQAYFERHPAIHYPNRFDIYEHFAKPNYLLFDRARAEEYFRHECEVANGRALVCSHERLSGCPHSGFYDCASIARLLCDVVRPRIVIVIREQYDMIASIYREYVNNGGVRTLLEYVYPPHDGRIPLFDWKPLRYVELISLYQEMLEPGNVKVLLFEDIKSSSAATLKELADFIGVEPMEDDGDLEAHRNTSPPDPDVERQRARNLSGGLLTTVSCERSVGQRWLGSSTEVVEQEFLGTHSFREMLRNYIAVSEFAESNRRLADLLRIDLSRRGYVM